MAAEDFAYFTLYKPGVLFNIGAIPTDGAVAPLHYGKMIINEDVFDVAPNIFIQFVLDQMNK